MVVTAASLNIWDKTGMAGAPPPAMSLNGPATMDVGDTVEVTVSASPPPSVGTAGYQTEVLLGGSGLAWVQRAACTDEVRGRSGGQNPLLCTRAFGPQGQPRHVAGTGVVPPLPPFDALTTVLAIDVRCDAAGTYKLVLTTTTAGASFGAAYYATDFTPINVATQQQDVDFDGDTATDYTEIADAHTIICGGGAATDTPTFTPTSTSTFTPTFTPTFTVPADTPTFTPTFTPTNTPTFTPTFTAPADTPTFTPTFTAPADTPTFTPTFTAPADTPTFTPTFTAPADTPTFTPTFTAPADTPTFTPTFTAPADTPTFTPTFTAPADTPTFTPTFTAPADTPTSTSTPMPTSVEHASGAVGPGDTTVDTGAGDPVEASVMIPDGAASEGQEISIDAFNMADLPPPPPGLNALPRAFDFGPDGLFFSEFVTLEFTYTDAAVAGLDESTLTAMILDAGTWLPVPDCTPPPEPDPCVLARDPANNSISVITTHFSTYGVAGTSLAEAGRPVVNAGDDVKVTLGDEVARTATFADDGGPHTCRFNWADGTIKIPTVSQDSAGTSGSCASSHTYRSAGTYIAQVCVNDAQHETGCDQFQVRVNSGPFPEKSGGCLLQALSHSENRSRSDTDCDGLSDFWEWLFGWFPRYSCLSQDDWDSDDDLLGDGAELLFGANPCQQDTDGDGISDSREIQHRDRTVSGFRCLSPARRDSDRDGLQDGEEIEIGTNPCKEDSDADGLSDGWEWRRYKDAGCPDPRNPDSDNDGATLRKKAKRWLLDGVERKLRSDPCDANSPLRA